MKSKSLNYFMLLMMLVVFIVAVYAYVNLPADGRYPVHWNIKGVPDRYGSRTEVVIIGPIIAAGIYVLARVLPKIDPKKLNYAKFSGEYNLLMGIIMLVLSAVYIIAVLAALGVKVKVELWIPGIIGVLFIIIGNYLGRVKQNWFMGIKTPWTLSNEKVWYKTHRFSARIFVLLGVFMIIEAFTGFVMNQAILVTLILGAALLPIAYSYIIYRQIEKEGK